MDQIDRLKNIELEIFKAFISACNKLGLKYYVIGGTLLGAVRHKGFIPWDDDIDVAMPRADYEIFKKNAQELLPKKYFIQCLDTEEEYLENFIKIRDCDTTFIENDVCKCNINHGIFLDVFPLDYYPENSLKQKLYKAKKRYLKLKIWHNRAYKGYKHFLLNWTPVKLFLMIPPNSDRTILKKLDDMYKSVEYSSKTANYCGAWGDKEIVPTEWYGEGVTLMFEGLEVCAPKEYDKWLTQVYGDYMQLPPIEKRVTHHYTCKIDTEKSYLEYVTK